MTVTAINHVTYHEPGIYFGMPEDEYHADPALGSSSIKELVRDPTEFQYARRLKALETEEAEEKAHLTLGTAMHKRILEGRAAYESMFCPEMDPALVKDALDTTAQIREWLDARDVKAPSKLTKGDLIKLALEIDSAVPIKDVIRQTWQEDHIGQTPLPMKMWDKVELAAQWLQQNPILAPFMEDGALTDGAPEVSIFYEDEGGVRLKARLDRLLSSCVVDLKSFSPKMAAKVGHTIKKVIENECYDLQEAAYQRAIAHAKPLFEAGKVFGAHPDPDLLRDVFSLTSKPKWFWVFVKTAGAPQSRVVEWKSVFAAGTAMERVEAAISNYRRLRDLHGEVADWPPSESYIALTDSDLPSYYGANR